MVMHPCNPPRFLTTNAAALHACMSQELDGGDLALGRLWTHLLRAGFPIQNVEAQSLQRMVESTVKQIARLERCENTRDASVHEAGAAVTVAHELAAALSRGSLPQEGERVATKGLAELSPWMLRQPHLPLSLLASAISRARPSAVPFTVRPSIHRQKVGFSGARESAFVLRERAMFFPVGLARSGRGGGTFPRLAEAVHRGDERDAPLRREQSCACQGGYCGGASSLNPWLFPGSSFISLLSTLGSPPGLSSGI